MHAFVELNALRRAERSRKGLHMSDDIVAAHLAAALIQAGSQKLDAKTAATIYFDCLEAVRAERQKRYEPPTGGILMGRAGNKGQPATTARGSASGGCCPAAPPSVIPPLNHIAKAA
jgi:hypothetical protein